MRVGDAEGRLEALGIGISEASLSEASTCAERKKSQTKTNQESVVSPARKCRHGFIPWKMTMPEAYTRERVTTTG